MNINLNNYEQYLLMYVDNELSAEERMQVASFLRDYPYLQQELDILQQTVLPVENILFDKSALLKPVTDEATQEKLLMHLDGELPAGESLTFQNKINTEKYLQQEWALLQKARLDPADIIAHPDKESLFRREKARVITFARWAAAAMLIAAGMYAGINMMNDTKQGHQVEVATNDPAANNAAAGNDEAGIKEQVNPVKTGAEQAAINEDLKTPAPVVKEDKAPVKDKMLATTDPVTKKNKPAVLQLPEQKINTNPDIATSNPQPGNKKYSVEPKELPQRNTGNVLPNNNEIAAIEKPVNKNRIDLPSNINTSKQPIVDRGPDAVVNTYTQTAALGFNDNNQNQILMMEEENVSRSRAGIFLKKLKRNVERRTNIKPGKSLRIAGFEFAVK